MHILRVLSAFVLALALTACAAADDGSGQTRPAHAGPYISGSGGF